MQTYKVIGWYAEDPHDETSTAFSLVRIVEAANRQDAFDKGEMALRKTAGQPRNLLNWYVKKVSPDALV